MAVLVDGNEIVLSGTVGDLFWDESFTASDVIMALAQVGRDRDVTVRINSAGGIATEGAAIHSALVAHRGRKTVVVEGIAASAASVIAMAGDEIVMSLGALMMVHDPSGFTFGTVEDHELQVRALTALATAMAGIYAEQTGHSVVDIRADMQTELWMTPEEAVQRGYADRVQGRAAGSPEPEPTAFNYRLFAHPPERLVALADQRAWSRRAPVAAYPAPPRQKGPSMTTPTAGSTAPATIPVTDHQAALEAAVQRGRTEATATAIPRADAAEIARLCNEGGVPTMTASLLAEGATLDQARARINSAGQITSMVALARRQNAAIPADAAATMIAEGKTVDQARAALFDKLVADQERTEVRSHVQAGSGELSATASTTSMQRELKRAGLAKGA